MMYPYIREKDVDPIYQKIKEIMPKDADKILNKIFNIEYINDKFVIVSRNDYEIFGFLFASVEEFDGELCTFIQFCFSETKGECQKMLDMVSEWSLDRDIRSLIFFTERDPVAWEKKYKFREVYKVMKREI